jgi:DNA modification methylase
MTFEKKFRSNQKDPAGKAHHPRFSPDARKPGNQSFKQPKPMIQTTTLWDFPSQHYGDRDQGDGEYAGVTPSYVIWNLIQRYTKPGAMVLDPMCGSGTTMDVCRDLDRVAVGFDLSPVRQDIKMADARKLPLTDNMVDFVFLDPPYSTHIKYSGDPRCIGELDARGGGYYEAMEQVLAELYRVVKPGGYVALYVQDSFAKGRPFAPLGFELFLRLAVLFEPVDIVCVTRHNKKLKRNHWHTSAIEGNFFLRGFNYLFIVQKPTNEAVTGYDHSKKSALSFYFRQVAKNNPGKVVTPEFLAKALDTDREIMDKRMVRKDQKKAAREGKKTFVKKPFTRDGGRPQKKISSSRES